MIENEDTLDELLTRPRAELIQFVRRISSPVVVLGAAGKMGPTLCVLAQRAAEAAGHRLEVIGVSRFSDRTKRDWLERRGVRTLEVDLLDRKAVCRLPDSAHVIYLVGLKFGTTENPARTWAVYTIAPMLACERYPSARIVALSTGNVYPMTPITAGGSVETDSLTPLGEYPNAAVARERLFEYHSQLFGTPVVLVRLNYAVELRYGVLVDIARKVWTGQPVDLAMGYLNCIWQGDANESILRCLDLASAPATAINLTGPEILSVGELARHFGQLLGRAPVFLGQEAETALLSNCARACATWGRPPTSIEQMMHWIAHWVRIGGSSLNKPTHFEVRDGKY